MTSAKTKTIPQGIGLSREDQGLLFIVSGPAGSGKTTLCERLLAENPERIQRIVTTTSRPPREGEREGEDYYFMSEEAFREGIENGEFFEWARVHNHYYGCLKREVRRKLATARDLLLNIDVQGAGTFRKEVRKDETLAGRLVTIFVTPRNVEVIRERLVDRNQDDEEEIKRRVDHAENEIRQWRYYDYCLLSGTREEDYTAFESIYRAEKMRNRHKLTSG